MDGGETSSGIRLLIDPPYTNCVGVPKTTVRFGTLLRGLPGLST